MPFAPVVMSITCSFPYIVSILVIPSLWFLFCGHHRTFTVPEKKAYFSEFFLLSSKFVLDPSMRNLHGTATCPLRPRVARPVQPALLARNFYTGYWTGIIDL